MEVGRMRSQCRSTMEHAGNPRGPIETKKRDRISTEFNLSIYQPPKQAPGLIRFIFIVNHKAEVTEVEQKKKSDRQNKLPSVDFVAQVRHGPRAQRAASFLVSRRL